VLLAIARQNVKLLAIAGRIQATKEQVALTSAVVMMVSAVAVVLLAVGGIGQAATRGADALFSSAISVGRARRRRCRRADNRF